MRREILLAALLLGTKAALPQVGDQLKKGSRAARMSSSRKPSFRGASPGAIHICTLPTLLMLLVSASAWAGRSAAGSCPW